MMSQNNTAEVDGLYDSIERLKSEKAVLDTKLREKVRGFEESFRQQETHRGDLQRQLNVLREQNDNLKRKYTDQLRQLQDAEGNARAANGTIDSLKAKIGSINNSRTDEIRRA